MYARFKQGCGGCNPIDGFCKCKMTLNAMLSAFLHQQIEYSIRLQGGGYNSLAPPLNFPLKIYNNIINKI